MALITGTSAPNSLFGTIQGDFIAGRESDDTILADSGNDTVAGDNTPIPLPDGHYMFEFGPFPHLGEMPGDNVILAGPGHDSVLAGFGAGIAFGEEGNDTLAGFGAADGGTTGIGNAISEDGPDVLSGGPGDDLLYGGGGDDLLIGGPGRDRLVGGVGVDTLFGGTERDVFVFGRSLEPLATYFGLDTGLGPGRRDLILDVQQGEDLLDVSRYSNYFPDSNTLNVPVFLGTGAFTAAFFVPQLRYQVEGDRTVVQIFAPLGGLLPGQPPGGRAEAEIELDGVHHLTAADFILR